MQCLLIEDQFLKFVPEKSGTVLTTQRELKLYCLTVPRRSLSFIIWVKAPWGNNRQSTCWPTALGAKFKQLPALPLPSLQSVLPHTRTPRISPLPARSHSDHVQARVEGLPWQQLLAGPGRVLQSQGCPHFVSGPASRQTDSRRINIRGRSRRPVYTRRAVSQSKSDDPGERESLPPSSPPSS